MRITTIYQALDVIPDKYHDGIMSSWVDYRKIVNGLDGAGEEANALLFATFAAGYVAGRNAL